MSGGYSLAVVHWILTATASLVADHGHSNLCTQVSVAVGRGLRSCGSPGSRAHRLSSCGLGALAGSMWDFSSLTRD